MERPQKSELKVDLVLKDGIWRAVVEQDGRRRDMDGLPELIRFLQGLAPQAHRPPRGLR